MMTRKPTLPALLCIILFAAAFGAGQNPNPAFRWPEGKRAALSLSRLWQRQGQRALTIRAVIGTHHQQLVAALTSTALQAFSEARIADVF